MIPSRPTTTPTLTPISEEQAAALDHELYELGVPGDGRHMRLVEFGSGAGELLARAVMTGLSCVGVELDAGNRRLTAARIEELISGNDGVRPEQLGMTDAVADLPANHFDFAIALGWGPDIPALVAEIARVLKPGGRWLITVVRTRATASYLFKALTEAGLRLGNVEEILDDSTTAQRVRVTGIKPQYEDAH